MRRHRNPQRQAPPQPPGRYRLPAPRARVGLEFLFVSRPERGRHVKSHTHEALELVYYTEGGGRTTVGETPCRIVRNTFTVTPAGTYHDQYSTSDIVAVCLGLADSGLEDLAGGHHDRDGVLRWPMERLLGELQARDPAFATVCQGLVLEIVGLVRRIASAGRPGSGRKVVVERALEMIRESGGALSVGDLSERLYVSKDYLRHLFKEYTRESPMRHIINTRVEKAKNLLGRDDLGIAEVAARCGIDNPYYFSRLFKQVTGRTPSAYRRSLAV